jgi:phospholipid/cholesterol/gamma-HCH transport system substrate-binding protein
MESDARYAWVGLVVVTLVATLVAGFYWLNDSGKEAVKRYTVYFQNQSLEGLQLNSDVRMQGIKVGKVADYTILPAQAKTVRVILEVDARTPVWEGAEAVVNRNLVTGLAAIDLDNVWKGGSDIGPPPEGEPYAVIDEGVPQMARISSTLEGLGKAGGEAVDRVNLLLSDQNQKAITAALGNIAGLTGELRGELRQLAPELLSTLGATRQAAARLDGVGAEMLPVLRESVRLVHDSGRQVEKVGVRFNQLAGEAESTMRAARGTLLGMDASLRQMQTQLRLSVDLGMQELQTTAQSMRASSDTLQATSQEYSRSWCACCMARTRPNSGRGSNEHEPCVRFLRFLMSGVAGRLDRLQPARCARTANPLLRAGDAHPEVECGRRQRCVAPGPAACAMPKAARFRAEPAADLQPFAKREPRRITSTRSGTEPPPKRLQMLAAPAPAGQWPLWRCGAIGCRRAGRLPVELSACSISFMTPATTPGQGRRSNWKAIWSSAAVRPSDRRSSTFAALGRALSEPGCRCGRRRRRICWMTLRSGSSGVQPTIPKSDRR